MMGNKTSNQLPPELPFVHALQQPLLISGYCRKYSTQFVSDLNAIILSYYKYSSYESEWSSMYKGQDYVLSEDNKLATLAGNGWYQCVRAKDPILPGMKAHIKFKIFANKAGWNFFGVLSSKSKPKRFNSPPHFKEGNRCLHDVYGIAESYQIFHLGDNRRRSRLNTHEIVKPPIPWNEETELEMIVDYIGNKNSKKKPVASLTFIYHEKAMLFKDTNHTIALPSLKTDDKGWYPAVPFNYEQSWVEMNCQCC